MNAPLVALALGGLVLVILLWQVSPWAGGVVTVAVALGLLTKAKQEGLI